MRCRPVSSERPRSRRLPFSTHHRRVPRSVGLKPSRSRRASRSLSCPAAKSFAAASACRRAKTPKSRPCFPMSKNQSPTRGSPDGSEIRLQARDPRASLPVDLGPKAVADRGRYAWSDDHERADFRRRAPRRVCAHLMGLWRPGSERSWRISPRRGAGRSSPLIVRKSPSSPVYDSVTVHGGTNRQRPDPVGRRVQQVCIQSARPPGRSMADCTSIDDLAEAWLGRQDSNLGMAVPKTAALPLGDAPR